MSIQTIAQQLVAPSKGILAADERNTSVSKRFDPYGIENNEENRRAYREMLFTTPGIEQYLSGVIMFEETLGQSTTEGVAFPQYLLDKGIIPGIKVDEGTMPLKEDSDETMTKGIEGLGERLEAYKKLGAQFTKWRAVIRIGENMPSDEAFQINAHQLAQYAKIVQDHDMVPIVEPEVLMEGDHDIETCFDVTTKTLQHVFSALKEEGVDLSAMLLKPNMVIAGKDGKRASVEDVAQKTVACFLDTVPADVPGIVFLSGGQSEDDATAHLQKMNELYTDLPWELGFSFGRALQHSALEAWAGKDENVVTAQKVGLSRAQKVSKARDGELA